MEVAETQKPRVLIIDDEEQIRHLLIDVLGDDYDCSDAGSAEEALAALERTVQWYVKNEPWWRAIKERSAEYKAYYEKQYASR